MDLALHSFQELTSQIRFNIQKAYVYYISLLFFYFFCFIRPTQAIRYLLKQSTFNLCNLNITLLFNLTVVIFPFVSTNSVYSV